MDWLHIFGPIKKLTLKYLCPVLSEQVEKDVKFVLSELTVNEICMFKTDTNLAHTNFKSQIGTLIQTRITLL